MFLSVYRSLLLIHITFQLFWIRGISTANGCRNDDVTEVVVIAFVDIFDEGTNCTLLSLRGLQQVAILNKTVIEINGLDISPKDMKMVLQIINNCKNYRDVKLKSVIKDFIETQNMCTKPPLLLGFLGPESDLISLQKTTSELQKYNILPFEPDFTEKSSEMTLYLGEKRLLSRGNILMATLNQLKWKSIYILTSDDMDKKMVIHYMVNNFQTICVTGFEKIPVDDLSNLEKFYIDVKRNFTESFADGLVILSSKCKYVRPLFEAMDNFIDDDKISQILLYSYEVGLKSWELPLNHTIIMLQETGDFKSGYDLTPFHNKTLLSEYYRQYSLDYKHDEFFNLLDPTIAAFEYSLRIFWTAIRYAKRIKCDLGVQNPTNGVCEEMSQIVPADWKSFLYKCSFYHPETLRRISLSMNVPTKVNVYHISNRSNVPQLIGRITDIGILDLRISLQSLAPPKPPGPVFRKCLPIPQRQIARAIPIDNETNWLAVFSKFTKKVISLNGYLPPGVSDTINTVALWIFGTIVFVFGLIILTKIVYKLFRIQTDEERDENKRKTISRRGMVNHLSGNERY